MQRMQPGFDYDHKFHKRMHLHNYKYIFILILFKMVKGVQQISVGNLSIQRIAQLVNTTVPTWVAYNQGRKHREGTPNSKQQN